MKYDPREVELLKNVSKRPTPARIGRWTLRTSKAVLAVEAVVVACVVMYFLAGLLAVLFA